MEKRGQVTIFVVLGLIVLITVAFFLFTRGEFLRGPGSAGNVEEQLSFELEQIEEEINTCVNEETARVTEEILEGGGYLENSNNLPYRGREVSILCQNIPEEGKCMATPLVKDDVEQRMEEELERRITECVDLSQYRNRDDYNLVTEELDLNLLINPENLLLIINYPITLERDEISVRQDEFSKTVNIPLGEILRVANDVLQEEASTGGFDPITYTLLHLNKYFVEVRKPYPDKVYQVSLRETPEYVMWFAVTDDGRYESYL